MAFMDKVKNVLGIPENGDEDVEDTAEDLVDGNLTDEDKTGTDNSIKTSLFGKSSSDQIKQNKVVNIHTTTQLQVVLVKPEHFDDARPIADHLNSKHTVVLNLESTNKDVSRRLIDFLSGVAYANNGQIKRVANSTYIITPYNVNIMGDLLDELESSGVFF
ncbi:MAG TPA: cell division protein SepF [Oscillospiraceae bacterium]|jgi:cell division inhibitor SepF|nr:cell division protein SepF [Oscillospiraceae bacterium]HPR39589.1 cell division protein SepF [Oscillospiraceae bacterium]HRW57745.1 cell division protein SepF [Oscillospiraceae bacterium]HXK78403.1 cell division protein SepF [Oscillospiraceae bacterium]